MTQRLPIPGQDDGTWGDILNDFLSVSLNADGSLNTTAVSTAGAEMVVNKGAASGYAPLNSSSLVPTTNLGTGSASSSTYLRGDGSWMTPNGGSSSLASDSDVTITSPANNQVLTYNSGTGVWENTAPAVPSVFGRTGAITATTGDYSAAQVTGALQASNNLSDVALASTARTNLGLGSAAIISSTAGGDLSGTLPSPTVAKINGVAVTGNPSSGQVITASSSSAASWQAPSGGAWYILPNPTGDTTGVTDSANFNAALTSLGGPSSGIGTIIFPACSKTNPYYFSANNAITSAGISVQGLSAGNNFIYQVGITPVIQVNIASFYPIGTGNNSVAGRVRSLTIDGTHATGTAYAMEWGNTCYSGYDDIIIQNFTGTGMAGIHMNNTVYASFTEQNVFEATIINCSTGVLFDLASGSSTPNTSSSFDRNRMYFRFYQSVNQNGVTISNGAAIEGGSLTLSGNFTAAAPAGTNTGYVLGLIGTSNNNDGTTYSCIGNSCHLDIDVELDGNGTNGCVGHQTIYFDPTEVTTNHSIETVGTINFQAVYGAVTTPTNLAEYTNGFVYFQGQVYGDSKLVGWPLPSSGALIYGATGTQISNSNPTLVSGYVLYSIVPTGGNPQVTLAVASNSAPYPVPGPITASTETLTTGIRIPFSIVVPPNFYLAIYDNATGSHGTATIFAVQSSLFW